MGSTPNRCYIITQIENPVSSETFGAWGAVPDLASATKQLRLMCGPGPGWTVLDEWLAEQV